jgi:hypothetical protein
LNHPGPHRVQNDVPAKFEKIILFFHENGLAPPLEDMTGFTVPPIVFLRIDTVKLTHPPGQISIRRFYHKMIVIVHETVGVAKPIEPLHNRTKHNEKVLSILIAQKNFIPSIATRGNVIDGVWIFYS